MGQLHKKDMDFLLVHLCGFVFLDYFSREGILDDFPTIVRNVKRQS